MQSFIHAIVLAVFLSMSWGCAGTTPSLYPNFWTQCIKADGWGISAFTAWGPINLGRVTWERNVACEKDQKIHEMPMLFINPHSVK